MHHTLRAAADTLPALSAPRPASARRATPARPRWPMDMIEDDAGMCPPPSTAPCRWPPWTAASSSTNTDHLMDNYSLRPAGPRRMFSPAESDDVGFRVGTALPRGGETYRLGLDYHGNRFDAYQQNAARVRNRPRLTMPAGTAWAATPSAVGLVIALDHHPGRARRRGLERRRPRRTFLPGGTPGCDAIQRTGPRVQRCEPGRHGGGAVQRQRWSAYEVGAARKNRAPNLIERYLWTPLSASAGQADGRTYLGDLASTRTAWQFQRDRRLARPTVAHARVAVLFAGGRLHPGEPIAAPTRPGVLYCNTRTWTAPISTGWT